MEKQKQELQQKPSEDNLGLIEGMQVVANDLWNLADLLLLEENTTINQNTKENTDKTNLIGIPKMDFGFSEANFDIEL